MRKENEDRDITRGLFSGWNDGKLWPHLVDINLTLFKCCLNHGHFILVIAMPYKWKKAFYSLQVLHSSVRDGQR
jgi:hypothetical protein